MVSPTQGLFALSVFVGLGLCGVAVNVYRQRREPGVTAFAVFLVAFGGGTALSSGAQLVPGLIETDSALWSPLSFFTWAVSIPPWIAFVLQYTGTYTELDWRTAVLLALPLVGAPWAFPGQLGITHPGLLMLGFVSWLYLLGVMTIGCYLLVRTAHKYGHLSTAQGAIIAAVPVLVFLESNFSGIIAQSSGLVAGLALHTAGISFVALTLVLGVYRYDKFQSSPAVGTIGEQAIVRQTDELMFVVDDDERLIKLNQTAADRLGVEKDRVLGDQLRDVLGESVATLNSEDTIQLRTDEGNRQFDPVLSELTDQYGRQIGYTLALHDVTELELREQRLEVLNRVLRHNLRNQVEIIQANAEAMAAGTDNEFADSIMHSAERLTELGRSARSVDRIVSHPVEPTAIDARTLVEQIVEQRDTHEGITVSTTVADTTVETDKQALEAAAESAIEGALSRATDAVTVTLEPDGEGVSLTVSDDGPGIPERELSSVTEGTETSLQHATGLELWRLKWAVTKLNGDLSFDTEDGTTVEITVPGQAVGTAQAT